MGKKVKGLAGIVLALMLVLAGCKTPGPVTEDDRLNVVATTTMLADLSKIIGGEHVSVSGLMGPGIDPHLYQASAGDVTLMKKSDVVVYNGLHLEGKMGEVFESLSGQGHAVICIEEGLDQSRLLAWEGGGSVHDPHIWFDVSLWKDAARIVADELSQADPVHQSAYEANLKNYLKELDATDTYIRGRVSEVPEGQRVLVTAHDAFNYFGKAYGFEVRGLQGISTDAEAGTADVSALANFIVERQIKAIFVESSVPPKTIEALQAAVKAKGFDVAIGGELYSDSLGGEGSGAESYILTVRENIDTIIEALK
ncbi:periplasmic zinc-binding protein TroA precursor [Oxobacter pfennigii]|uniref:Periplasmic zinc-binding protein TroA n=1 Tax=Oxobacter pfennigii TaxID=36849 RepID=A0A0P8YVY4_9CLOT|nr:zinc ABC transporter substrate-binding protein [Oxobacter pfennigii]KPU43868.1 periplasmic zinc-binding protein TroA precursor [Oxobacter pfennigii]